MIGRSRFPVRILEDEGPVGWRGVRHYRYLKHGPDAPAYETGGPEAELEPARPDEVPAGG